MKGKKKYGNLEPYTLSVHAKVHVMGRIKTLMGIRVRIEVDIVR